MKICKKVLFLFFLLTLPLVSNANEWVNNVEVVKIGAYQHGPGHFVWLSSTPAECQGTLSFSEGNPGGKSLLSILLASLLSKAPLSVQVNGCDIIEVYITNALPE